eukprot:3895679-Pleurochrysis_carterae.AAC.1
MAATGAGVLQPSTPGVSASVGCVGDRHGDVGRLRSCRIISLARTARNGEGGAEIFYMRVGQPHWR